MIKGILKKHRNELFKTIKKSKIGLDNFGFFYDEKKCLFEIHIKGHDFGFIIIRSKNDIDFFDTIQGDALRKDDAINIRGDFLDVESSFTDWLYTSAVDFLKTIKEEEKVDDLWATMRDPLLNIYQEEYFEEFKIVDKNADKEPFSIEQQLYIDTYLEEVIDRIESFRTESNSAEIEEIKSDSKELKENLTKLTKSQTVKRLTQIWAKMRKSSIKLVKEFVQVAKQELFKAIVKGFLE